MNWNAVKAGYGAALFVMLPILIGVVWAINTQRHGVAIFLLFGWLIFGNIAFIRAYNKKKGNRSKEPPG